VQSATNLRKSSEARRHFRVGQNGRGQWVAVDADGTCGGIFISREAAMHFAAFETDRRPGAISLTSRTIDIEI
jgi:hypothetical protein